MIEGMDTDIPSVSEIRAALNDLGGMSLNRLSRLSGCSLSTLHRIQSGESENPGVETVRSFWGYVQAARLGKTDQEAM